VNGPFGHLTFVCVNVEKGICVIVIWGVVVGLDAIAKLGGECE
jgi:hypothetical protein